GRVGNAPEGHCIARESGGGAVATRSHLSVWRHAGRKWGADFPNRLVPIRGILPPATLRIVLPARFPPIFFLGPIPCSGHRVCAARGRPGLCQEGTCAPAHLF